MLIDVTISGDINVIKKETKKSLKYSYKNLKTEIQYVWNVTTKVIPVITGANGTI
jgi:starvation-inducible outer membrane lipoprotein